MNGGKQSDFPSRGRLYEDSPIRWNDAPTAVTIFGRETEVQHLLSTITEEGQAKRLLSIVGLGGVGKTAMAVELVRRAATDFECVLWLSLVGRMSVKDVATELAAVASGDASSLGDSRSDAQHILTLTQQRRCLVVLDNFETVLTTDGLDGFEPGFEAYGQLLRAVSETRHCSF